MTKTPTQLAIEAANQHYINAINATTQSDALHKFATTTLSLLPTLLAEHDQAIASLQSENDDLKKRAYFHPENHSTPLQQIFEDQHLVEEICEHYAKCDLTVAASLDWVVDKNTETDKLTTELEAARAALKGLLIALDKTNEGCNESAWAGFENGNGDECGEALDLAIKTARLNLSNTKEQSND